MNIKVAPVCFTAKTVLLSGLLVGSLDILSAFIDTSIARGGNPFIVLNYIASGILGKEVIGHGNAGTMLLGLLLHYFIAFSFTLFFFWLCKHTPLIRMQWIFRGILYGMFIWVIMNLVVVQLSAVPHGPISAMKWNRIVKSGLILICMIGLPLSFIVYRCTRASMADTSVPLT